LILWLQELKVLGKKMDKKLKFIHISNFNSWYDKYNNNLMSDILFYVLSIVAMLPIIDIISQYRVSQAIDRTIRWIHDCLFDPSYFYLVSHDNQYIDILQKNIDKTITEISRDASITQHCDILAMREITDNLIKERTKKIKNMLSYSFLPFIRVSMIRDIKNISEMICRTINQCLDDKRLGARYQYNHDARNGSFQMFLYMVFPAKDPDWNIYGFRESKNPITRVPGAQGLRILGCFYLIPYNESFHEWFEQNVACYDEIKKCTSTIVDGTTRDYLMIPHEPAMRSSRAVNPDHMKLKKCIARYCLEV
jgi:hypothetical protein